MHPKAPQLTVAAAVFCLAFVAFALVFGMGEWKDTPPPRARPSRPRHAKAAGLLRTFQPSFLTSEPHFSCSLLM